MATPSMNLAKPKLATGKIQPTNYGALSTLVIVFFLWDLLSQAIAFSFGFASITFHN